MQRDPQRHNQLIGLIAAVALGGGLVLATRPTVAPALPLLVQGAATTVAIVVPALGLAAALALLVGVALVARQRGLRALARGYVELIRGTSLPVQLFWLFFVLPHFGVRLSADLVAIVALGLNTGAYGAEVVRGGIAAVPRSQIDAALALCIPARGRLFRIILPQALIAIVPAATNLALDALKGSALVSLITITDLTFQGRTIIERTYRPLEIYAMILVFYLLMAAGIMALGDAIERRLPGRPEPTPR